MVGLEALQCAIKAFLLQIIKRSLMTNDLPLLHDKISPWIQNSPTFLVNRHPNVLANMVVQRRTFWFEVDSSPSPRLRDAIVLDISAPIRYTYGVSDSPKCTARAEE